MRVGFITVQCSVLEPKSSGPWWLPMNCGHSDGFSPFGVKEFCGEFCGWWARSSTAEDDVEI